jgi:hypothetical protein
MDTNPHEYRGSVLIRLVMLPTLTEQWPTKSMASLVATTVIRVHWCSFVVCFCINSVELKRKQARRLSLKLTIAGIVDMH